MAIDTAEKRLSLLDNDTSFLCHLPVPDGSLDQGDRQHVIGVYSGLLAVEPVIAAVVARISFAMQQRAITFSSQIRAVRLWLS